MSDTGSVILTASAKIQSHRLVSEVQDYAGKKLRLYLDGKGCDGFFYGVTFDNQASDDLVFPQADGVDVIVDPKTLLFVKDATIDWVDDERGTGFLVDNPNHKKFRGKFYKRQSWQAANLPKT